jgi:hypothetical protein
MPPELLRQIKHIPLSIAARRSGKTLRRPRIQAARNGHLIAAPLWRDMQADDFGVSNQLRKIARLKEQFWLRMHRVKRLLRQRVANFAAATRQRRQ